MRRDRILAVLYERKRGPGHAFVEPVAQVVHVVMAAGGFRKERRVAGKRGGLAAALSPKGFEDRQHIGKQVNQPPLPRTCRKNACSGERHSRSRHFA